MTAFTGSKWRFKGAYKTKNYNCWYSDEYVEKREFAMASSYRRYLAQKKHDELQSAVVVARNKLEYLMKEYGLIDDIEYDELLIAIRNLKNFEKKNANWLQ